MTCVKDFELELCFIGENNKLSNLKPIESFKHNIKYSRVLAYCYLAMKHNERIWVDDSVYHILSQLFIDNISKKSDLKTSDEGWTISEIDTSIEKPEYYEGEVLMPVYVSENNTIVYNIHSIESMTISPMILSNDYIKGAINFFNCVVRSKTAGTKRVIWKDPVILSTRLQNENYDKMFALYIAKKFMTASDYFPQKDAIRSLGVCMRFLDIIEQKSSDDILTPKLTIREFNKDMLDLLIVNEINAEYKNLTPTLTVDASKRDLSSVLYFFKQNVPDVMNDISYVNFSGYQNYSFVETLSKLYPKAQFIIWEPKLVPGIPSNNSVTHYNRAINAELLNKYPKKQTLFISKLRQNDVMLTKFGGLSAVAAGYTSIKPISTFLSLYTGPEEKPETLGYAFIGTVKKSLTKFEVKNNILNLERYNNYIKSEYRDNKWKYSSENKIYNFDDLILNHLINS